MQYICTMPDSLHLADFLEPVSLAEISNDEAYHDGQIGKDIEVFDDEFPDLLAADIILLGCTEQRGNGIKRKSLSPDVVRHELYKFYNWHSSLKLADAGNIKNGAVL